MLTYKINIAIKITLNLLIINEKITHQIFRELYV